MGILSPEFLKTQTIKQTTPIQPPPETIGGSNLIKTEEGNAVAPLPTGQISDEEQIKRYGGIVGSPEYYRKKEAEYGYTDQPLTSIDKAGLNPKTRPSIWKEMVKLVGINIPDDETWDKLSRTDQAKYLGNSASASLFNFTKNFPKETYRMGLGVANTIIQPFYRQATGQPGDLKSLREAPPLEAKWFGGKTLEIPSFYNNYESKIQAGQGPLAATVLTSMEGFLDVAATAYSTEFLAGLSKSFVPKGKLKPGEQVKNIEPIKYAYDNETGVYREVPKDSPHEYYTMPKEVAANYGGKVNNTYWKFTPAEDGAVETSLVRTVNKKPGEVVNMGGNSLKVNAGDLGSEVKIFSQTIKGQVPTTTEKPFALKSPESTKGIVNPNDPNFGINVKKPIITIPTEASVKMSINKNIDPKQITNLENIANAVGKSNMLNPIIKSVTGKSVIGELNQGEYVKVAQTFGMFQNRTISVKTPGPIIQIKRWLSPTRHWTDDVERTTNFPIKTAVRGPLDQGLTNSHLMFEELNTDFMNIFGKYASPKYVNELTALNYYHLGDTNALSGFSADIQKDLIGISDKMKEFFNKTGPAVGIPFEKFVKDTNYLPRVQNIGGVKRLYKSETGIPNGYNFFAEHPRVGNLSELIDNPIALGQIYLRQGIRKINLDQTLKDISTLSDSVSEQWKKDMIKSIVQEKLGYADFTEKWMDNITQGINKKFGWNLPPDATRQLLNIGMSTVYSGLLSSPAVFLRQPLQIIFADARMGPKFSAESMAEAVARTVTRKLESKKEGFTVDLSVPYGTEIAKESSGLGKGINLYKKSTQALLWPISASDNFVREYTFQKAKRIWSDAIGKYNEGKYTWEKTEQELDLNGFTAVDRQEIRKKLFSGDIEGARKYFLREIIDEANFPYRKGESPSAFNDPLLGKPNYMLLSWSNESGHTLWRWFKDPKQWGKLVRFFGMSRTVQKTIEDTLGVDFTRSLYLGPYTNILSPAVQAFINFAEMLNNVAPYNKKGVDDNRDALIRTITSSAPAGVETRNVTSFIKSLKDYDPSFVSGKPYPIYDAAGKLKYWGDFPSLFKEKILGLPTSEKETESNIFNSINNDIETRSQISDGLSQLVRDGKLDEAIQESLKTGVPIPDNTENALYVERLQRTFNNLPKDLKAKYSSSVFSDLFNNNQSQ